MTKADAQKGIRYLCGLWAKERGMIVPPIDQPSFTDFYAWVQSNYPAYLDFRTTTGVQYDVEMWFDQEFKQTWRN